MLKNKKSMKQKNVYVTILVTLILLVTVVFIGISLQEKNSIPFFNKQTQNQTIQEAISQQPFILGTITNITYKIEEPENKWIKVLTKDASPEYNDVPENEAPQREYLFYLSEETQGDKDIQGGDRVKIFSPSYPSETDYIQVENIEKQ